jgi:hypothetical protein
MALTRWPPRSPDLTPCDLFLSGYIKDRDFVPPLPVSVYDLNRRITTAVASVDETCSGVFGTNWIIILICHVTRRLIHRTFVT